MTQPEITPAEAIPAPIPELIQLNLTQAEAAYLWSCLYMDMAINNEHQPHIDSAAQQLVGANRNLTHRGIFNLSRRIRKLVNGAGWVNNPVCAVPDDLLPPEFKVP